MPPGRNQTDDSPPPQLCRDPAAAYNAPGKKRPAPPPTARRSTRWSAIPTAAKPRSSTRSPACARKSATIPGVTVEKKIGETFSQHGRPIKVIDLPGAYSLAARSPDEAVLRDVLLGRREDTPQPDRIICVVDASNLERNLYLVHQILDLGRPVIVVLNMMDVAAAAGLAPRSQKTGGVARRGRHSLRSRARPRASSN
jgi:hypothetical protein